MKTHHLYIDELGSPNPSSPSHDYFILSTCSVPDSTRDALLRHAEQIRFKYWGLGSNDITFHSYHIGRKTGAFAIFRGDDIAYQEFLNDILALLKSYPITTFVNLTDHAVAYARNWDTNTVLSKSTTHAVESFVRYLVGCKVKGKIVIESATDAQNTFFLKAFTTYLAPNATNTLSFRTIQESLTSLSIVTKNNHDIEEQIADLFAYAARCKYERDELSKTFRASSYEAKIINVLERKLYSVPSNTAPAKKRILNKIESFKVLTN
jgi:hypothetical protein